MQSANYLARTGPDQLALSASFPGVELIGVVLLIVSVIGLIVLVAMLNGVKSVHSAVKELAAQLGQGIPSEALAQARPTGQPEPPTGAGPPAGPVPAAYPSLDLPVEQSPFAAQAGEARPGPQPPSVSAFDGLATPALAAGQGLPGEAPVSEPPTMSQPLISLPGSEPVSQAAAPVADDSLPKALNTAARREISLVGRALKILDELEQSETDPDKLFSLFALDNLMARMRRGSETQMILVGREPERSVREPLSASDVIRTALSQIEHYERIRISLDWDPMIRAYAVVPAAHMIAELLENATRFSPEGTAVEVGSSNHSGDVVLTISDAGVGMSAQELAAANRMMQAGGNPDDLSHGRLGVAVVARLATRLGASVSFAPGQSSDGTGTTAIVRIPSSLIDDRPVAGAPMDQLGAQAVLPPQPKLEDAAMESSVNSFEPVRLDPPTTDTGLPRRSSRGQGGMPSSPFGPPPSAPPSASPPDASRADSIVPLSARFSPLGGGPNQTTSVPRHAADSAVPPARPAPGASVPFGGAPAGAPQPAGPDAKPTDGPAPLVRRRSAGGGGAVGAGMVPSAGASRGTPLPGAGAPAVGGGQPFAPKGPSGPPAYSPGGQPPAVPFIPTGQAGFSPGGSMRPEPGPVRPAAGQPVSGFQTGGTMLPGGGGAGTAAGGGSIAGSAYALKASIQEEALAELAGINTYKPERSESKPASSLTRRPTGTSAVPAPAEAPAVPPKARDADKVRSAFSSFQLGTRRGRSDARGSSGKGRGTS